MGLLDNVLKAGLGKILGSGNSSQQDQLVGVLLQHVFGNKEQGQLSGLGDLVDMLRSNGLGDLVESWVSQGSNAPVDSTQIERGFDSRVLENIASEMGTSQSQVAKQLSEVLPGLIDKLTPQGQADNSVGLDDAIKILGGLLSK